MSDTSFNSIHQADHFDTPLDHFQPELDHPNLTNYRRVFQNQSCYISMDLAYQADYFNTSLDHSCGIVFEIYTCN